MAKHKKRTRPTSRDRPGSSSQRSVMLCSQDTWTVLCADGYKPLTECSEVKMCINAYARAVATMTIHLMQNVKNGDIRVRNGLSRKVDINPAPHMGRTNLMYMIVRTMMERGNALVYPEYRGGYLEWLRPLKPSRAQIMDLEDDFRVQYNGRTMMPDELLNFVYNPDPERPWRGLGVTVDVGEMVKALRQAGSTRQSLLESPAPALIIKVADLAAEFQEKDGQEKLAAKYASSVRNGQPWFVPSEAMEVTSVKPMSIADLAIKDNLELDKRAVAAMLGIPAFMVGVGAYNDVEYKNFIAAKLPFVTEIIEQELNRGLLIADDLHFRLNKRSLMAYSIGDITSLGQAMVDRMAMRRNEWRDLMDLPPDDEMEELLALENYLPEDRLGDQKKLNPKGGKTDGKATDPSDAPADESAAAGG
jgi:HK97 family phage portal protein